MALNNDRVKIEYHDGRGEVTPCWSITIDEAEIFNIYIKLEENRFNETDKTISFVFNPLYNRTYEHSLTVKSQDGVFRVVKTERKY